MFNTTILGTAAWVVLVIAVYTVARLTGAESDWAIFLAVCTLFVAMLYQLSSIRGIRVAVRLWRLSLKMRTRSVGSLRLRYPHDLEGRIVETNLPEVCVGEMNNLANRFGYTLPHRVTVYVLPTEQTVSELTGGHGGWAQPTLRSVVVPIESGCGFHRVLRNVLARLFAARLGGTDPSFKSEGLAGLMEEWAGGPPDSLESWPTPPPDAPSIRSMLKESLFYEPQHKDYYYGAAANFTAFLVRRFGWLAYCRFYRQATRHNYVNAFYRSFSVSLEQADADWRGGVPIAQ